MEIVYILLTLLLFSGGCYSEEIKLESADTGKFDIQKTDIKKIDTMLIKDKAVVTEILELQKSKDLEDIENLWKGTVENNQVIGFALKKLSTPESQRRIHSSLMAKTLSAIVAGSSFLPYMAGADYTLATGAFAAGRLAQNLINKKSYRTI